MSICSGNRHFDYNESNFFIKKIPDGNFQILCSHQKRYPSKIKYILSITIQKQTLWQR